MKSKTDYSDMSIGLNLSTSLTTWDGDPSAYVVRVSGTIMPIGGDDPEEEVGSVQAILCRLGEAMNDSPTPEHTKGAASQRTRRGRIPWPGCRLCCPSPIVQCRERFR